MTDTKLKVKPPNVLSVMKTLPVKDSGAAFDQQVKPQFKVFIQQKLKKIRPTESSVHDYTYILSFWHFILKGNV